MAEGRDYCDELTKKYIEEQTKIFNELDDNLHKALMKRNNPKELIHYDGFLKLLEDGSTKR